MYQNKLRYKLSLLSHTHCKLLHYEQSSFSNLSVTLPTSQLILQPFRRFAYVTAHSPTQPLLHLRHSSFSNPSFASPTSQALHLIHPASRPWHKGHTPSPRIGIKISDSARNRTWGARLEERESTDRTTATNILKLKYQNTVIVFSTHFHSIIQIPHRSICLSCVYLVERVETAYNRWAPVL